jgi:hypothetical protein
MRSDDKRKISEPIPDRYEKGEAGLHVLSGGSSRRSAYQK